MDTSLVEGYIFLFKVLDLLSQKVKHVILAVIGLLAKHLEAQCPLAAVTLQGAFAYLNQYSQFLIVEQTDFLM